MCASVDSPNVNAISVVNATRIGSILAITIRRKLTTGASSAVDVDLSGCKKYYAIFVESGGVFEEHSLYDTNRP